MRVLYFHQHFTTPRGSGGTRSYELARRMAARGHEVTVVCGSYEGGDTGLDGGFVGGLRKGRVDGIGVIEQNLPYSNDDGFIRRTWTFLRFALQGIGAAWQQRPDVIIASSTPLTAGIPGIIVRWLRGTPFVFEVRDLWPELPRAMGVIRNPLVLGAMSCLEWLSYRSAHRLIGLSPGIVAGISRRGVPADRITLVPNGSDVDLFGGSGSEQVPGSAAEFVAVFAGTHGQANGLDNVLDAAAELRRRGRNDIRILLIGNGKLKPRLQARAAREGLDIITFHDPVDKQTLARVLCTCDVGLQILANVPAFYFGTSPNKFFDYLASGIPVLINYPGWLAELVAENDCGFAVEPDSATAFADALERAASDRAALRAMGTRARQLAKREFDRDTLAQRWIEWVEGAYEGADRVQVPGT